MTTDHPQAQQLGWQIRSTSVPFINRFLSLHHDEIVWPDGHEGTYTYMELPPVVIVVPITVDHKIVLIRQYRYTLDEWVWEVPAGGSHDFDGDDLADLAARELREEVGGRAEAITYVGAFNPAVGRLRATFHLYLATGVTLGAPSPEPGEQIEIHSIPTADVLAMAYDGTITNSTSAYAILRCVPLFAP